MKPVPARPRRPLGASAIASLALPQRSRHDNMRVTIWRRLRLHTVKTEAVCGEALPFPRRSATRQSSSRALSWELVQPQRGSTWLLTRCVLMLWVGVSGWVELCGCGNGADRGEAGLANGRGGGVTLVIRREVAWSNVVLGCCFLRIRIVLGRLMERRM